MPRARENGSRPAGDRFVYSTRWPPRRGLRSVVRRRRAPARGRRRLRPPSTPVTRSPGGTACSASLVGEIALLVISNVGLIATNAAFGCHRQHRRRRRRRVDAPGGDLRRLARRAGSPAASASTRASWSPSASSPSARSTRSSRSRRSSPSSLATNSHHLIDLGPMDLGNLFSGDLLALFGGSVGGLLSGKR